MSELNFSGYSQASMLPRLLEALRSLRSGEVLTADLGKEGDPDFLIAEARKRSNRWDFQKHRLGDGSWLLHVKVSSKRE
ncbi:MAG: hypothetical protein ACE5JA_03040 [bacterium]